jgi:hypothetical protein
MSSRREGRGLPPRSDLQVLANQYDMKLLAAVAAGTVIRPSTSAAAPFLLDDSPVDLRRLAREDLVFAPISGIPKLQARGDRLLAIARGELPTPLDD